MIESYWLNKATSYKLGRLKKYLTVPAFNIKCGESKCCISRYDSQVLTTTEFQLPQNQFCLEVWIKPVCRSQYICTKGTDFALLLDTAGRVTCIIGGLHTVLRTDEFKTILFDEWNHIGLNYDGTIVSIYINGQLAASTAVAMVSSYSYIQIASQIAGLADFGGYLDEIKLWKTARSYEQLTKDYQRPVNKNNTIEPELLSYWKMNSMQDTIVPDEMNLNHFTINEVTANTLNPADGYPIKYGASWTAGVFDVDLLTQKVSLQYPVKPPTDANFALVVKWIDDNEEVQRRYLWTVDGVDLDPTITEYSGEVLPADSWQLEVWNIDGASYCTLTEDFKLYISETTLPKTSVDKVNQSAGRLNAINDSLGLTFPAAYPLTFNTQQWTLDSTIVIPSQPPDNNSYLLTEDGNFLVTEDGKKIRL